MQGEILEKFKEVFTAKPARRLRGLARMEKALFTTKSTKTTKGLLIQPSKLRALRGEEGLGTWDLQEPVALATHAQIASLR